jgi:hypothetical protein
MKKGQFKKGREERLQRDIKSPWSLSYWHLPVTPSHYFLQRVRGFVVGLTGMQNEMTTTTTKKYS